MALLRSRWSRRARLRPAGFPAFLGQDFFLIGYRVFVRFNAPRGRSMRGLYILRSETDKRRMQISGNLFTRYAYRTIDVDRIESEDNVTISSNTSGLAITYREPGEISNVQLPPTSPFANWQEARKFAGPLPYTFTVEPNRNRVLIIEGVRENWRPQPVEVLDADVAFLDELGLSHAAIANAFLVRNIPYRWMKGRYESC